MKEDRGLWHYDKTIHGCKYLTLRRDGSVFPEPNFTLGPRDPLSPQTVRYYASEAGKYSVPNPWGFNEQYVADCHRLANDMELYRIQKGDGDPGKGPHRTDLPLVIEQMIAGPDAPLIRTALQVVSPLMDLAKRLVSMTEDFKNDPLFADLRLQAKMALRGQSCR